MGHALLSETPDSDNRGMTSRISVLAVLVALLCAPVKVAAQSVTLGGNLSVASAEDFATRTFQDPWDMNERTDFGWFLNGSDPPLPQLSNVAFTGGIFSATTGNGPNLFLLETGNPNAASLGKTGTVYPIDANTYHLFAVRMRIDPNTPTQATLSWNRTNLYDGTFTTSNTFNVTPAVWRTYLIDLQTLGVSGGPIPWSGLIRSLQFNPSFQTAFTLQIDWIRLVSVNASLCRQVTWSGLTNGQFDLYLSADNGNTTATTLLAQSVANSTASNGCAALASGYNFYAGGLAAGSYKVIARRTSDGATFASASTYVVNDAPTLTFISPSAEGSTDDFATTQLANAWDMDATTDVEQASNVTGQTINTSFAAETPAGVSLGNVRAYVATSTATSGVGDPILVPLAARGDTHRIDPSRYRILTVELGIPNAPRNINNGSIARVLWRVVGGNDYTVSDDIIFNTRAGVNVMDKINLDMADRSVLSIEASSPSQLGWAGSIDRFRFDPHEYSAAVTFYVKRIKLAALERVNSGSTYTFQWTASKPNGTVSLYYDSDRDPSNGNAFIATVATSAGSYVWNVPVVPLKEYYIYAVINDGQGNVNATYARWPIVIGQQPPLAPPNIRILH